MTDFQHDEKVVSGYDPILVRRILAFARPHLRLLIGAACFLILATTAEVLIPVVIQRAVDHHILDVWVRVRPEEVARFGRRANGEQIGDWVYLREEALDQIDRTTRTELTAQGKIDGSRYLLVPNSPGVLSVDLSVTPTASSADYLVYPRAVLDRLTADERAVLRAHNIAGLRRYTMIFLSVLLAALIGSFGQVYLTAFTGQRVMQDLRIALFDHVVHQSLRFLNSQPVGRLVTRLTNDVETINELFTSVLAELAKNAALMVAVVVTMFSLNPRLAMIVVTSMLPVLLLTDVFRRKARDAFRNVRHAVSAVNAYLSEYISGMPVVQMFVQQERSRAEFGDKNERLNRANLTEMYVFATFRPIIDFLSSLSTAVVLYFGARLVQVEVVSLGVLIAFTNLVRRFYMPVMSISEQFTILQSAMAGSERVFELLDHDDRIPDRGVMQLRSGEIRGDIEFDRAWFGYKSNEPVLKDVSFNVSAGQMVAIVGYTGAGKTTIINLLTRLWDLDQGSIRVDGHDIRDLRVDSLRSVVQQIQQDVFLFSDTIRNNITLGLQVDDEILWRTCETVQLADFIRALPAGLDTHLEERGANLSAGQRQLVSFARVLIHNPPILVLDEATSNIDSDTERRLQIALDAVTGGRTSVVIAHRLSTIQHADKILVLSHGELVEAGSHRELLERDGLYASLYRLQYAHQGDRH